MTIIAYLYHVRLECVGPVRLFSVYRIPRSRNAFTMCVYPVQFCGCCAVLDTEVIVYALAASQHSSSVTTLL